MPLQFSAQLGCWERYLQRKYQNPLFLDQQRQITQRAVDEARARDEAERRQFYQSFQSLLEDVAQLHARVEAEVILRFKERVDTLYEQCAQLAGDLTQEKSGLRKLMALIMDSIWSVGIENPDLAAQLRQEEAAREAQYALLDYPFVAHLLRTESPVQDDEIVPFLLSEQEDVLRAAMSLFTKEQQSAFCDQARHLLLQLQDMGYTLPEAWIHLTMMEQPLLRPN
ncbi:MAG: hypothetical protein RL368_790 [Pseudomonadota bacterium]|jgi:hypothetical protein